VVASEVPASPESYDLTPRQVEILNLIGRGLSNRDISELLGISVNTVKVHVRALMAALDVSNRTEAVFVYERLKRMPESPAGEALSLAGATGRPAIAVLPFAFTDADQGQHHLPRALSEDLIARVGVWKWFRVLGYTAVAEIDPDDFAAVQRLGAQYCVSGHIRRLGEHLQVNAELVHAPDATVIWSARQSGDSTDLVAFIETTARQIVGRMAPELLRRDGEHAASRSFPAWNEASRAMWHIYVGSRAHSAIAAEAWERAIALDPNLVFAWYAKAAGLYQRVFDQWSEDPRADMAAFVEAAERCVALDISDSAAQEICGFARLVTGRLDDAIVHLERAVSLNPSNAQAYSELGQAYTFRGRYAEGIAAFEEALSINPQGDSTWSVNAGIAFAWFLTDELDQAISYQRRAVAINPNILTPQIFLAGYLAAAGQLAEARTLAAAVLEKDPTFRIETVTRSLAVVSRPLEQKFAAAAAAAGLD
jgi:TolB-like protein/DNA-binding CsgD family transcriptional regulator/Tfp pilus assembly protein PilF